LSDEILFKMLKKSLVLNVSDQKLDNTNVLLLEGNLVNFLEKYEFVPNQEWLDLTQLMRVNIQIILENSLETQFKAVELLEGSDEILSPLVCKMLDDVPVVTPDLTVSTKTDLDPITGVKIEQFVLTPESNLLLIVATKLLKIPLY
jgi:fatty acid synthase